MGNINPAVSWACATLILAVILVGMFALVWHGSLTSDEVMPVVSAIALSALTIFGVSHGVNAGAKAANKSKSD